MIEKDMIFMQDNAPSHIAKITQEILSANCTEYEKFMKWLPSSSDLDMLDYFAWNKH
jgi:hypothetical protein